jgi:hypothetical protein
MRPNRDNGGRERRSGARGEYARFPARRHRLERRLDRRLDRTSGLDLTRHTHAELIAVHVVELDWTQPLDADVAERSEEAQRVLDAAEGIAESIHGKLESVLVQARDVGAAIVDEAARAKRTC